MGDRQEQSPVGRKAERAVDERGLYGPGYLDEITEPEDEARQAREAAERDDVADHPIDPQIYRDGGPTETPGMVTTTGGKAGPASVRRVARQGPDVAPTTTGDATSGGLGTPVGGSTSDATTGGSTGGTIVGGSDVDPDRAYNPEEGAGADRT
ncbi:hypothetical protein ACNTMW_17630 [Planosporangium sp. 12N6]|uniref:hypothetical protein n=1 Tax=Planosporangium spinosum TaxID=3402278 RepID=UPI003CEBDAEC